MVKPRNGSSTESNNAVAFLQPLLQNFSNDIHYIQVEDVNLDPCIVKVADDLRL